MLGAYIMDIKDNKLAANGDSNTSPWANVGGSHKTLQKTVTDALRQCILSGEFKPGDRLTEVRLAEMFNVSRNPIREALSVLHIEGIIEMEPRKGARIPLLTRSEIEEIIEIRSELEGMSAKYAAVRCTKESREAFKSILEQGDKALEQNDLVLLQELNQKFHKLLSEAGRNRFLASFMRSLHDKPIWFFENSPEGRIIETWKEHGAILQAVISSDPQLSAALAVRHVKEAGRIIVESLDI